ncbi:MAG TPA: PP2C family protein-serine/threonine phosphatase, partial [Terracidiphilus sp.]
LLTFGYSLVDSLAAVTFQFGWQKKESSVNLELLHSPYPVGLKVTVFTIFAAAMMLFLIRRFSLARREEERLSGELAAARGMQSLLVPAANVATPGFHLESIYLPASEVGGDFFQVLPGKDGSLLIVVGDVSGKGLKAAMTVSAIVGALRGCTFCAPAEVLAYLNGILHGQIGGFVTCTAALITEDGAMIVANAGHLAPYKNGEEMSVPSGIPLGMLAEASYEETKFELAPADHLTFVSDGVVEARNAKGELLGFERVAALTNQPAAAIAEAAERWGQEDDITVVSLALAPAGVAHV